MTVKRYRLKSYRRWLKVARAPKGCRREGNFFRCRQKPVKFFDKRSFRTITRGKNKIVIGCPKGKWSPKKKRCKVGTVAQTILRPVK